MRRYTTEAIVLKNLNYGDAHKFYTLYTRDYGKISALALGVRKISSRRAGNLDTLNRVSVSISEDNKGFKTIQEVRTIRSFYPVKNDLRKISAAYQLTMLLNDITEYEHDIEGVYDLFLWGIGNLETADDLVWVANMFKFKIFDILGYGMELDSCVTCGKIYSNSWRNIMYNPAYGGILCPDCGIFGISMDYSVLESLKSLRRNQFGVYVQGSKNGNELSRILKLHQDEITKKR